MPSSTTRSRKSKARSEAVRPAKLKLYPVDLAIWDDGNWARPIFWESLPKEIDEPWPYRFKRGDKVWIRACNGEWHQGKVVSRVMGGKTKLDDGLWWCIQFRMTRVNVRKWVAPLNGDLKPDNEHTHQLLSNAGCLLR